MAAATAAAVLVSLATVAGPAAAAPANDDFADALAVVVPSTTEVDTTGGTVEPGEPEPSCWEFPAESHSAWFALEAPADGPVLVDTFGTSFAAPDDATVLAVHTGAGLGSLIEIACNDDIAGTFQSQVGFTAAAGTRYWIQAGGWDETEFGTLRLNVTWAQSLAGTVRDQYGGLPVAGVAVDLFAPSGHQLSSTMTDGAGAYARGPATPGGAARHPGPPGRRPESDRSRRGRVGAAEVAFGEPSWLPIAGRWASGRRSDACRHRGDNGEPWLATSRSRRVTAPFACRARRRSCSPAAAGPSSTWSTTT